MSGPTDRLLALLSLLQARREWPSHVLAERMEVSARTVRRDVERLRALGYRITSGKGPHSGYTLEAGSELPPLLFDEAQAVAIAVALRSIPSSGIDIDEAASRALTTVRQVMPSRLRHRVDAIQFTDSPAQARVDPAVLEAVAAAVRARQILRFDYGEASDRPPRRTEPHAVVARDGRWYVIAWDLERDDWRIFRMDRMLPRTPTGPGFTPRTLPARDAETFLAARSKGSAAENRWPCTGTVRIELPASAVAPWIGDGQLRAVGDASTEITIGSWSWAGVLAQAIRFDAPFVVIGPEPLRHAAAALAERFADAAQPTRHPHSAPVD
ncbi:helix-turn-helix transcriptional regulator [Microbacterium keratanolyticum]